MYLRHDGFITRVILNNHQYKDVTHSIVEELDFTSSEDLTTGKDAELWMCDILFKLEKIDFKKSIWTEEH